ncbi:MAG: hypothetical protein ISR57_00450 [Bacteroidales bacterium]|nr:hypothetical protein [Bacteroidota bacterium]MBL6949090.1 hypothetical protein [Bacteroidales bacterium]
MKRNSTFFFGNSVSDGGSDPYDQKNNKSVSPREYVIRNILNYSKSLSILKTHRTGTITLVMN